MRVCLKSIMEAAHYFKNSNKCSMATALKAAWAMSRGEVWATIITTRTSDGKRWAETLLTGKFLAAHDMDVVQAKNEIARAYRSGESEYQLIMAVGFALSVYKPQPMAQKHMTFAEYFAA